MKKSRPTVSWAACAGTQGAGGQRAGAGGTSCRRAALRRWHRLRALRPGAARAKGRQARGRAGGMPAGRQAGRAAHRHCVLGAALEPEEARDQRHQEELQEALP
jgi:hypothetical protein